MSLATAPALTGSFKVIMTNLWEMEKRVHEDLRVFMWRPPLPDAPCIWNWMPNAPLSIVDQAKWRDTITVVATVAIAHTDVEVEMDRLMTYVDAFRDVVDKELYAKRPLAAHRAKRAGMNMSNPTFGGVAYLGVEFPLVIEVDRMFFPS
jgi:hypothetical protein